MIFIKIAVTALVFAIITYAPVKLSLFKDYDEEGFSRNEMIFGLAAGGLMVLSVIGFIVGIWLI